MGVIGAFGNKVFEVSQNKIYTFSGLTISEKLSIEMQETEGGKPATYIKGYGEMDITFEILLLSRFCNVDYEIDYWLLKMRSKKPEYLTIGKKAYGTNKHLLVDVQVNDIKMLGDGTKVSAKVSLAFKEWTKAGYKKEETTSSTGSVSSSSDEISTDVVNYSRSKLRKRGELDKTKVLGDRAYVNSNTTTVDGVDYYYDNGVYYLISDLTTVRADGGRSTMLAFPKGTPWYV